MKLLGRRLHIDFFLFSCFIQLMFLGDILKAVKRNEIFTGSYSTADYRLQQSQASVATKESFWLHMYHVEIPWGERSWRFKPRWITLPIDVSHRHDASPQRGVGNKIFWTRVITDLWRREKEEEWRSIAFKTQNYKKMEWLKKNDNERAAVFNKVTRAWIQMPALCRKTTWGRWGVQT